MNVQQPLDAKSHDDGGTRGDRQLRLLRALWLTTFAVILLIFLVGVIVYFRQMLVAPTAPNWSTLAA